MTYANSFGCAQAAPRFSPVICTLAILTAPAAVAADPMIQRIDHMVPHVSTAPGNEKEEVELFVRERSLSPAIAGDEPGEAVLMLPGGRSPSVASFDLDFEDYSWAEALASAGHTVFLMDPTGYGFSPRPGMDDPCNVNPELQDMLVSNPLEATCEPGQGQPVTMESDWAEIDTVIDFIRDLKGIEEVVLVSWSRGTFRIGGYAARHPDKVSKLIFFGPSSQYASDGPSEPQEPFGFATRPNTPDQWQGGWNSQVQCGDQQLDPAVRPEIWAATMAFDPLGATWGNPAYDPVKAPLGGIGRSPRLPRPYGFNAETAGQIEAPALIIVGQLDQFGTADPLFEDLGSDNKIMVKIDCASHWAVWERTAPIIHHVSIDWLEDTDVAGIESGVVEFDITGQPAN